MPRDAASLTLDELLDALAAPSRTHGAVGAGRTGGAATNAQWQARPAGATGAEWAGARYRAPRNPVEALLCALFAEALSHEHVGIDDNFFSIGGDSILSILLVSRARRAGLKISPRDVFLQPTVAALAAVARHTDTATERRWTDKDAIGDLPLTPDHPLAAGARRADRSDPPVDASACALGLERGRSDPWAANHSRQS